MPIKPIIEDISRETVEQTSELMKFTLDWQAETGGEFGAEDMRVDRFISAVQFYKLNGGASSYLWCGDESTVSELYGKDFALAATGCDGIPDSEFEFALGGGYHQVAHTKKPLFQFVRSTIDVYGKPYEITYHRAVFPMSFATTPAIGVMSQFLSSPTQLETQGLRH